MAIKTSYVFRETASNLKRNFTLTLASLLTVAVSLALAGGGLLMRQGVDNATTRWRGDIEFIVFMKPDAAPEQIESVRKALGENPEVLSTRFVDKQEAFAEFQVLFRNSPDLLEVTTADILPTSFRVEPRTADTAVIRSIGTQFRAQAGVLDVVFAEDAVDSVLTVTHLLQTIILVIAVVLLGAAVLLIFNTIRLAMFARRREVEVMKLVGATNWFIRLPFMLEGLVQGLLGAGTACGLVVLANRLIEDRVVQGSSLAILQNFSVSSAEVSGTCTIILVLGTVVGTLGSGVAVSRFLDV